MDEFDGNEFAGLNFESGFESILEQGPSSSTAGVGVSLDGQPSSSFNNQCLRCDKYRSDLERLDKEHRVNFQFLKKKIISTDLLIRRCKAKTDESEAQAKVIEDLNSRLEQADRDSAILSEQLKSTVESMKPMKDQNEHLEDMLKTKSTEVYDLQTRLAAEEAYKSQRQALDNKMKKWESETNDITKRMSSLQRKKQDLTAKTERLGREKAVIVSEKNIIAKRMLLFGKALQQAQEIVNAQWRKLQLNGLAEGELKPYVLPNKYKSFFDKLQSGEKVDVLPGQDEEDDKADGCLLKSLMDFGEMSDDEGGARASLMGGRKQMKGKGKKKNGNKGKDEEEGEEESDDGNLSDVSILSHIEDDLSREVEKREMTKEEIDRKADMIRKSFGFDSAPDIDSNNVKGTDAKKKKRRESDVEGKGHEKNEPQSAAKEKRFFFKNLSPKKVSEEGKDVIGKPDGLTDGVSKRVETAKTHKGNEGKKRVDADSPAGAAAIDEDLSSLSSMSSDSDDDGGNVTKKESNKKQILSSKLVRNNFKATFVPACSSTMESTGDSSKSSMSKKFSSPNENRNFGKTKTLTYAKSSAIRRIEKKKGAGDAGDDLDSSLSSLSETSDEEREGVSSVRSKTSSPKRTLSLIDRGGKGKVKPGLVADSNSLLSCNVGNNDDGDDDEEYEEEEPVISMPFTHTMDEGGEEEEERKRSGEFSSNGNEETKQVTGSRASSSMTKTQLQALLMLSPLCRVLSPLPPSPCPSALSRDSDGDDDGNDDVVGDVGEESNSKDMVVDESGDNYNSVSRNNKKMDNESGDNYNSVSRNNKKMDNESGDNYNSVSRNNKKMDNESGDNYSSVSRNNKKMDNESGDNYNSVSRNNKKMDNESGDNYNGVSRNNQIMDNESGENNSVLKTNRIMDNESDDNNSVSKNSRIIYIRSDKEKVANNQDRGLSNIEDDGDGIVESSNNLCSVVEEAEKRNLKDDLSMSSDEESDFEVKFKRSPRKSVSAEVSVEIKDKDLSSDDEKSTTNKQIKGSSSSTKEKQHSHKQVSKTTGWRRIKSKPGLLSSSSSSSSENESGEKEKVLTSEEKLASTEASVEVGPISVSHKADDNDNVPAVNISEAQSKPRNKQKSSSSVAFNSLDGDLSSLSSSSDDEDERDKAAAEVVDKKVEMAVEDSVNKKANVLTNYDIIPCQREHISSALVSDNVVKGDKKGDGDKSVVHAEDIVNKEQQSSGPKRQVCRTVEKVPKQRKDISKEFVDSSSEDEEEGKADKNNSPKKQKVAENKQEESHSCSIKTDINMKDASKEPAVCVSPRRVTRSLNKGSDSSPTVSTKSSAVANHQSKVNNSRVDWSGDENNTANISPQRSKLKNRASTITALEKSADVDENDKSVKEAAAEKEESLSIHTKESNSRESGSIMESEKNALRKTQMECAAHQLAKMIAKAKVGNAKKGNLVGNSKVGKEMPKTLSQLKASPPHPKTRRTTRNSGPDDSDGKTMDICDGVGKEPEKDGNEEAPQISSENRNNEANRMSSDGEGSRVRRTRSQSLRSSISVDDSKGMHQSSDNEQKVVDGDRIDMADRGKDTAQGTEPTSTRRMTRNRSVSLSKNLNNSGMTEDGSKTCDEKKKDSDVIKSLGSDTESVPEEGSGRRKSRRISSKHRDCSETTDDDQEKDVQGVRTRSNSLRRDSLNESQGFIVPILPASESQDTSVVTDGSDQKQQNLDPRERLSVVASETFDDSKEINKDMDCVHDDQISIGLQNRPKKPPVDLVLDEEEAAVEIYLIKKSGEISDAINVNLEEKSLDLNSFVETNSVMKPFTTKSWTPLTTSENSAFSKVGGTSSSSNQIDIVSSMSSNSNTSLSSATTSSSSSSETTPLSSSVNSNMRRNITVLDISCVQSMKRRISAVKTSSCGASGNRNSIPLLHQSFVQAKKPCLEQPKAGELSDHTIETGNLSQPPKIVNPTEPLEVLIPQERAMTPFVSGSSSSLSSSSSPMATTTTVIPATPGVSYQNEKDGATSTSSDKKPFSEILKDMVNFFKLPPLLSPLSSPSSSPTPQALSSSSSLSSSSLGGENAGDQVNTDCTDQRQLPNNRVSPGQRQPQPRQTSSDTQLMMQAKKVLSAKRKAALGKASNNDSPATVKRSRKTAQGDQGQSTTNTEGGNGDGVPRKGKALQTISFSGFSRLEDAVDYNLRHFLNHGPSQSPSPPSLQSTLDDINGRVKGGNVPEVWLCLVNRTMLHIRRHGPPKSAALERLLRNSTDRRQSSEEEQEEGMCLEPLEQSVLDLMSAFIHHHQGVADRSVLMGCIWSAIFDRSLTSSGVRLSLCRLFCALCRKFDDLEQTRVLLYNIAWCGYLQFSSCLLSMVEVWPSIVRPPATDNSVQQSSSSSFSTSPICQVFQLVMFLEMDKDPEFVGQMLSVLEQRSGWTMKGNRTPVLLFKSLLDSLVEASLKSQDDLFEYVKAAELLCVVQGSGWTQEHFVQRALVGAFQRWHMTSTLSAHAHAMTAFLNITKAVHAVHSFSETTVRILGGQVLGKMAVTKLDFLPLTVSLGEVLMELCPLDPKHYLELLRQWEETNQGCLPSPSLVQLAETRKWINNATAAAAGNGGNNNNNNNTAGGRGASKKKNNKKNAAKNLKKKMTTMNNSRGQN